MEPWFFGEKTRTRELPEKRKKNTRRSIYLRQHRMQLPHRLAEAGRLCGRLLPPGRRCPASRLLWPTAKQARRGTTLLPAAPSRRRSGGTRAMARRRLAAWDDFRLVVIRPIVEAGSKTGAAHLAAGPPPPSRSPPGHVPPGRRGIGAPSPTRPQVEGESSAKAPRLVRDGQKEFGNKTKERKGKRKHTMGGGCAREYCSLPNRHYAESLQFAR